MNRASSRETIEELARHFTGLFPEAQCSILDTEAIRNAWGTIERVRLDKQIKLTETSSQLLVPLVDPSTNNLLAGLKLAFDRPLDKTETQVARALTRVFNADIKTAPRLEADRELWLSLQQTRFSRAIGRYASFGTDIVVRWLRSIENATTLKYEGKSFSIRLLICRKADHATCSGLFSLVSFTQPVPALKALFGTKWIRALSQSEDISLLALTSNVSIVGVLRPVQASEADITLAPHVSLAALCGASFSKALAIVASPSGDLFAVCPNGGTFLKRQGHWHFLNYAAITSLLQRHLGCHANLLAQMALNLAYERRGALFVVLREGTLASDLVPDSRLAGRANEELREFASTLSLSSDDCSIIQDIAAIDGAVVIAADGSVIDCACMVSRPEQAALKRVGLTTVQQFDGARTTAAWNASIHGLAVKISEDGPITFWEDGLLVLSVG